jgi:hypothetical protein
MTSSMTLWTQAGALTSKPSMYPGADTVGSFDIHRNGSSESEAIGRRALYLTRAGIPFVVVPSSDAKHSAAIQSVLDITA